MKGQSFLKVCSIILVLAGVFMLAAGGLGFTKILSAKDYKENEKASTLESLQTLEDGIATLAENQQAYDEGTVAYSEGQVTLAEGKAKLAQGEKDYAAGQQTLANAKVTYNEGVATYEAGQKAYQEGLATYNQKYQEYLAGKAQLEENTASYNTAKELMASSTVKTALAALAAGEMITPSVQAIIDTAQNGIATYEAGQKTLAEAEVALEDARGQLEAARAQLSSGQAALKSGASQIAEGEQKLSAASSQLSAGYASAAQGEQDLADGAAQLAVFEDGQAQIAAGIETVRQNERAAELMDEGADAVSAGRTAVDEATEATTKDLMSRLYCYLVAMFAGILAIIAGCIGSAAAKMPSINKIKGGIFLGAGTLLVALVANVYHLIVIGQHTTNLVDGFDFVAKDFVVEGTTHSFEAMGQISTMLQTAAIPVLGIAAILFVAAIIKYKNALVALLTGE